MWHQAGESLQSLFRRPTTDFYRMHMITPATVRGLAAFELVKMNLGPPAAQFLCKYDYGIWEWAWVDDIGAGPSLAQLLESPEWERRTASMNAKTPFYAYLDYDMDDDMMMMSFICSCRNKKRRRHRCRRDDDRRIGT